MRSPIISYIYNFFSDVFHRKKNHQESDDDLGYLEILFFDKGGENYEKEIP